MFSTRYRPATAAEESIDIIAGRRPVAPSLDFTNRSVLTVSTLQGPYRPGLFARLRHRGARLPRTVTLSRANQRMFEVTAIKIRMLQGMIPGLVGAPVRGVAEQAWDRLADLIREEIRAVQHEDATTSASVYRRAQRLRDQLDNARTAAARLLEVLTVPSGGESAEPDSSLAAAVETVRQFAELYAEARTRASAQILQAPAQH